MTNITFEKATLAHQDIIFSWLDSPHVQEFWDNTPEHRQDIVIFMNGRKETSSYFGGINTYWVGKQAGVPYAFLLTTEAKIEQTDLPSSWREHLSTTGKTYTIDFCIGNVDYFGKGLAAPTLEAFCQFIHQQVETAVDTFIIDPDINNPRAKHVYAKAGFKEMGTFIAETEAFKGHTSVLMIKKIE